MASCVLGFYPTPRRPARGEQPRPPSGEVRLSSGRVVQYKIDFNRNALRASLRVDGGFIASAPSGALMKFESPSMRLVKEGLFDQEITALGHGREGAPLAGLADGRICRVDPIGLELDERFKLPSQPQWIGWIGAVGDRPAGLVVVVESTRQMEEGKVRFELPCSIVHDLATGKVYPVEELISAFLVDRTGRLWLGWDEGEWGGGVYRVELGKGAVTRIPPPPSADPGWKPHWEGVYGFIERPDGQIWANGGTSHMGSNSGFITRIDEAAPRSLFTPASLRKPVAPQHPERRKERDPDRPSMPLTHIVEQGDHLLVFSYDDVFRVDEGLKGWKRAATLNLQYHWGRTNAMGSLPSVDHVYPPAREGGPLVLATSFDGFVALGGGKVIPHGLPGQLDVSDMDDVTDSAEGLLLRDRWSPRNSTVWKLGKERWEIVDFSPPFEVDPTGPMSEWERSLGDWRYSYVLVGPDGTIFTVNQSGASPGTRTVARWTDGKAVRMDREVSEDDLAGSFITGDGVLWNDSRKRLRRLRDGKWEAVFKHRKAPVDRFKPIPTKGPPWILLEPESWDGGQALWRLDDEADGKKTTLVRQKLDEGADELKVRDAIPWTDDLLLLATGAGLRTYDPAKGTLARVDLPEPPKPVAKLVRDRAGRLWLGGDEGLWLIEPEAKEVESLDPVPAINGSRIDALAADPARADGVVAVVQDRGVFFLRADVKP